MSASLSLFLCHTHTQNFDWDYIEYTDLLRRIDIFTKLFLSIKSMDIVPLNLFLKLCTVVCGVEFCTSFVSFIIVVQFLLVLLYKWYIKIFSNFFCWYACIYERNLLLTFNWSKTYIQKSTQVIRQLVISMPTADLHPTI